jgi:hypothetical protein
MKYGMLYVYSKKIQVEKNFFEEQLDLGLRRT